MTQKQNLDISALPVLLTQHQQTFDTLAHRLIEENKHTNLTRITDPEQIRSRHFLDSLAALPVLDQLAGNKSSLRIADVGSGAGFPVLPLAIVRPDWQFTSIEATGKKVNFQKKAIAELGLKNITVIHARAEELAHEKLYREQFDIAVARAVADLRILAELSLPFVKIGGLMLAFKSRDIEKELTGAVTIIKTLGGESDIIWSYSLPDTEGKFHLISIAKTAATPIDYPRSYSIISKKAAN
ncbi:MAG: 16S rRNA (guanine(527)-N(7))-methyltransferase RsmG [Planctomycetes bacterium]|nr:16S rRNA (guanine(527)-N(7))-methyltransferase RsmG [Planctomycetota bacterium]